MEIIGYICYVLAAIDFIAGNFLGIDFTGVFWSPIALAIIGSILVNAGSSDEQDEDPDNIEDSDNTEDSDN
tara:strand:+ start:159 stop:371 length:213 start_codon:yes stop_codon:yes gene_type:complete